MTPDISVIVPTYNRLSTLLPVVDGILAQTMPVREVLVVDDGSTDETAEELPRQIAQRPRWSSRVRYLRQENQGQSAALNHGIAESRGQWLGFCAHDDLWLPWKLEWQFRALGKYGAGLCFTDAWFMNNPHMKQTVFQFAASSLSENPVGSVSDAAALVAGRHPVWVQTVIAAKELVQRAGGFDPFLRYSEDHDFLFRMALLTRFCYVSLPMVLIDRSPALIRHSGPAENWHKVEYCLEMDQHRFEKQWKMRTGLSPATLRTIRHNLHSLHSHWATYHLVSRDYRLARNDLRTALRYGFSARIAAKHLLTAATPALARWIFLARDQRSGPRHDRSSWLEPSASK